MKKVVGNSHGDLMLSDFVKYAKYSEALRQGDENFRFLRQKLDSVLLRTVVFQIVRPELTLGRTTALNKCFERFFLSTEIGKSL